MTRAKDEGLSMCPLCHKLNPACEGRHKCSRCHGIFYQRNPKSIQYTIAWTVASIVMFIPANLYPMMIFNTLGQEQSPTILGGIFKLLDLGMYPVAIVVFIASFIIPLGKILGLVILVQGVHKKTELAPEQRSKLYNLVKYLGPWSMLDVFVVALMAAVVNLGFITSISVGTGINYFALMVIFTMFAAESFDPRLIWDNQKYES